MNGGKSISGESDINAISSSHQDYYYYDSQPVSQVTTDNMNSFPSVAVSTQQIKNRRLYPKNESPALPTRHSPYGAAKRLEFDGDLRGAFQLYMQALSEGDRPDSALKDISNIYIMYGRVKEAVEFLKLNEKFVTNRKGYENLLFRLELELKHQEEEDYVMPRVLRIEVLQPDLLVRIGSRLGIDLCDRIFPNPAKIRRILHIDSVFSHSQTSLVQFSTYSSARKALQALRSSDPLIKVTWATPPDQALLMEIEFRENARDNVCIECRKFERLPEHLIAFDDETSFVSVYHTGDRVVLEAAEKVVLIESIEYLKSSTIGERTIDEKFPCSSLKGDFTCMTENFVSCCLNRNTENIRTSEKNSSAVEDIAVSDSDTCKTM